MRRNDDAEAAPVGVAVGVAGGWGGRWGAVSMRRHISLTVSKTKAVYDDRMPRRYDSSLRTERASANRAQVVAAATRLFCERGWAATTMGGVADAAGLSRQTVYAQFDGKLSLLDACIDEALTGAEKSRVSELPDYLRMGRGDAATRLTAGAAWLRGAHERSAGLQDVLDQAAVTDPAAARLLRGREQARWRQVRHALTLVGGTEPADEAVDAVWVLASRSTWLRLVRDRGWTADRWEAWFATQTRAALETASSPG